MGLLGRRSAGLTGPAVAHHWTGVIPHKAELMSGLRTRSACDRLAMVVQDWLSPQKRDGP